MSERIVGQPEIKQSWFKPKTIADLGLILDSNGHKSYRHILRLIKTGKLKARVWAKQGIGNGEKKEYYQVHIDEILRYNSELYDKS